MKRLIVSSVLASLFVLAPVLLVAAEAKFDPAARAKAIAPYLDEQTLAAAHVDLGRVAVGPLFEQLALLAPTWRDEMNEARAPATGLHNRLVQAGVKDVYFVLTLARGLRERETPIFAVIPAGAGADEKAIAAALPGLVVQRLGDVLVAAGKQEMLARLPGMTPDPRPEMQAAFEAAGDTAAQVLLLPPKDYRRVIEETQPELPKELGGGPSRTITRGLRWAAIGIDAPPQTAVRLVIQSDDAASAEAFRGKLVELMRLAGQVKQVRQYLPKLDEAIALLTPRGEGGRLVLTLDENNQGVAKAIAVLTPPVELVRMHAARNQSAYNLKMMALAMHNCHDIHKSFPPPGSLGPDKKPLLSWRVLVLPYLDQKPLYDQFHLDERWDSPHNRTLIDKMPDVYRFPLSKNKERGRTNYAVPVGNGAAFTPGVGSPISEFRDGTSNTILIVEVDDQHAPIWTRPDDWRFDPKEPAKGLGRVFDDGFNTAFADGSVRFIPLATKPDVLRAIFTRAGGEPVSPP